MELEDPNNGEIQTSEGASTGEALDPPFHPSSLPDDVVDSTCSTPYVSAPSSPGRGGPGGYFFSAPASPVHFVLSSFSSASSYTCGGGPRADFDASVSGSFEFEFASRCSGTCEAGGPVFTGSMISADELFLNGQIRPMRLSSHLQRPQVLAPLLDLAGEAEEDDVDEGGEGNREEAAIIGRDSRLWSRSLSRRTRSLSPLRNPPFPWQDEEVEEEEEQRRRRRGSTGEGREEDLELDSALKQAEDSTPSVSASSSRSSSISSSRSSKRWVFLKDLLYRSKSEGRASARDKFRSAVSFSASKERSSSLFFRHRSNKDSTKPPPAAAAPAAPMVGSESQSQRQKNVQPSAASPATADATETPNPASSNRGGAAGKRRVPAPSPHERHYTANRAQAEEMRRKTFLPYRQGLLGCLWFSSGGYGSMNGLARTLNPVSSR